MEAFDGWVDSTGTVTGIQLEGCRALPALVKELDPTADAKYLSTISTLIHTAVLQSHFFERGKPRAFEVMGRMRELRIEESDSVEERRRKCDAIRSWWGQEGYAYHQGWRFWSTRCRAPLIHDW